MLSENGSLVLVSMIGVSFFKWGKTKFVLVSLCRFVKQGEVINKMNLRVAC